MPSLPLPAGPLTDTSRYAIEQADCLSFLRERAPSSVDVIVTDPAYSGMNRHLRLGHGRIVGNYSSPSNDGWFEEFNDDARQFAQLLKQFRRVLKDDRHVYIMFDSYSLLSLGALVRRHFDVKGIIVWDKQLMGMGNYFRRQHELIVFASKGRRAVEDRSLTDVWEIKRRHRPKYPTQKPVGLFEKMLAASAESGFVVCDPFVGSGSSAIAALRQGCTFVGCDTSIEAVDLSRARCEAFVRDGVDHLEPERVE